MIDFIHKKTLPILLAIIFSIVGFGAFAGIAEADITTDLSIGLHVQVSSIPSGIAEIPPDLKPDQAQKVLQNIINDTAVQGFLVQVTAAQTEVDRLNAKCALDIACAAMASSTTSAAGSNDTYDQLQAAKATLNDANVNLGNAIMTARDRQESLVKQYRADNLVQGNTDATYNAITSTTEAAQSNISTQGQTDALSAAEQAAVSQAQVDAAKIAHDNAANFLNSSGDAVALTMQKDCSFIAPTNITPCIAEFVYTFVYRPTAYALMGSGFIFDKLLMLSIDNSKNMVTPDFINTTWTVVRDFSNMMFIFILLYTGVMTILGQANWRQTVLKVIFIALIINFSLFFTKVVIDAGNILAVGVRNAISTDSLSAGLASAFQPQKFLSISASTGDDSGGAAIIVFLVAAVVSGFAAYIFFKAAILFARRLIVFWALMILSPFAFVSIAFPKGSKFQDWLGELAGQTFAAPVFLFFLYIIMTVIQAGGGILTNFSQTGTWFESLVGPVIVAMLLIKALQEALKYTEHMVGSTGEAFSNLVGGAMGLAGTAAIGAATGGVGLIGRATLGRAAQGLTDSGRLARVATGKSILGDNAFARFAGRQAIAINDKARTGTWDVSETGVGKKTIGKAASSLGMEMKGAGAGAKGGFEGSLKRQEQADLDMAKKLKVTDKEKEAMMGTTKEREEMTKSILDSKKEAKKEAEKAVESTKQQGGIAHLANQEKLNKIIRDIANAEKDVANATKAVSDATKEVSKENLRRRASYADYAGGGVRTGIQWATGNAAYSHSKAQSIAKKIREVSIEEIEKKETKKKEATEMIEALTKEKEGHKEEKPAEKPAEKKADH